MCVYECKQKKSESPTLCDAIDCNLPGLSVHGILQARILEWVAVPFSRGSSRPRNRIRISCIVGRFFTSWITEGNFFAFNYLLNTSCLTSKSVFCLQICSCKDLTRKKIHYTFPSTLQRVSSCPINYRQNNKAYKKTQKQLNQLTYWRA